MPSVMAIVSKAVFEKEMGKSVKVGDVVATERYSATPAAFDQLEQGDSIFFVTVRPPDERLWLVGVIDTPKKHGKAWVGKPNTTPIRDVTSVIKSFEFTSGKGLAPKPGALGMSLQTPRLLTAGDVTLLRGAVQTKATRTPPAKAPRSAKLPMPRSPPPKPTAKPAKASPIVDDRLAPVVKLALDGKGKRKHSLLTELHELIFVAGRLTTLAIDAAKTFVSLVDRAERRRDVLDVLRALATAFVGNDLLTRGGVDDDLLDIEVGPGVTVRDVRAPIVAGEYVAYLRDDDVEVRLATAMLLAVLLEQDVTAELKAAAATELDEAVRYNLLFALVRRGVKVEVPPPKKKDAALAVLSRLVAAMQSKTADGALLEDARKITKLTATRGFPGLGYPYTAVSAALVGAVYARRDADGLCNLVTAGKGMTLLDAFDAIWPLAQASSEPLSDGIRVFGDSCVGHASCTRILTRSARIARTSEGTRFFIARSQRSGFARSSTMRRTTSHAGMPSITTSAAALSSPQSRRRCAGGRNGTIPNLGIPYGSWSGANDFTAGSNHARTAAGSSLLAQARYSALMRATFAEMPDKPLVEVVKARDYINWTSALSVLVDRNFKYADDSAIADALENPEWHDIEGLRRVIGALPEARRAALLAKCEPSYCADNASSNGMLLGLWSFADLVPDALLPNLVDHLAEVGNAQAFIKPRFEGEASAGRALRADVERVFRDLGRRAAPHLRDKLDALKSKAPERALYEAALAAAAPRV